MTAQDLQKAGYPRVACALEMLADWVRQHREAATMFLGDPTGEMAHIAQDLGLSPQHLRSLAAKGPHAADEMLELLKALKLDPKALSAQQPMVMRDLERVCSMCNQKRECDHDIAAGKLAETYEHYCPNADTLRALLAETDIAKSG